MIGYFVGDQPMRTFVAHTVVTSRKNVLGVGRLRLGFVHRGEGGLHIALGDWQTDLYNCSQAVGFEFSHIHMCTLQQETWTDLHHLCVAETVLAVPCCRLMFMTYIFRHCGLLILKIISVQAHRNRESVCVCACALCVAQTDNLV